MDAHSPEDVRKEMLMWGLDWMSVLPDPVLVWKTRLILLFPGGMSDLEPMEGHGRGRRER